MMVWDVFIEAVWVWCVLVGVEGNIVDFVSTGECGDGGYIG